MAILARSGWRPAAVLTLATLAACLALVACGGGGGDAGGGPGGGGGGGGGGTGGVGPIATDPANQTLPRIEPYERTATMDLALGGTGTGTETGTAAATTTAKQPASPSKSLAEVDLGPLTASQQQAREAALVRTSKARPIGLGRTVAALADPAAMVRAWSWLPAPGGGWVASVRVRSPGAAGLRLGLRAERLPAGAVLRVRGERGEAVAVTGAQVLQALGRNAAAAAATPSEDAVRTYWLAPVAGEAATLEVTLPAGTDPAQLALTVPQLSHLWWTHAAATDAAFLKIGEAGGCNLDIACSPEYAFEARSVARLEFVDNGNAFLCTGTLLADATASGTPWFLTARHCVGNQAAASTITTFWFYRAATCNSNTLDPAATQRHGGATLLHTSDATDIAFLRLDQPPPAGAVHAGSLLGPIAVETALVGLHHPGGDLLKLSVGRNVSYARCDGTTCSLQPGDTADYLTVRWDAGGGTTESGSSGSAVFAAVGSRRYVVGHLFAGSASCTSPTLHDFYGRLDRDYPALRPYLGSVPGT